MARDEIVVVSSKIKEIHYSPENNWENPLATWKIAGKRAINAAEKKRSDAQLSARDEFAMLLPYPETVKWPYLDYVTSTVSNNLFYETGTIKYQNIFLRGQGGK